MRRLVWEAVYRHDRFVGGPWADWLYGDDRLCYGEWDAAREVDDAGQYGHSVSHDEFDVFTR